MSDDPTLPPRQPNTPRVWIGKAAAWLKANPIWAAALAGVLVGLLLPVLARALFG